MKTTILFTSAIVSTVLSTCQLKCPEDMEVVVDSNCYYKVEDFRNVNDDCQLADLYQSGLGGYLPLGEHSVKMFDAVEYQNCEFKMTVVDNTPPIIKTIRGEPNLLTGQLCNNGWETVEFHFNKYENCCGVTCNITSVSYEDEDMECEPCGLCDGKVSSLTLRNDGPEQQVTVYDKRDEIVIFNGLVGEGETFLVSCDGLNCDNQNTLGTEIHINGLSLHTSCSQPIYIGMTVGDFVIVNGYSRNGGKLCREGQSGGSDSKSGSGSESNSGSDSKETSKKSSQEKRRRRMTGDSEGCTGEERQWYITGDRTVKLCGGTPTGCFKRTYTITGMCLDDSGLWTTKTTTVVATNVDYTEPDPGCEYGIENNGVCCMDTCGQCGGAGCGSRPGGNDGCCTSPILVANRSCATNPPPCVM